jgi:hypothetical protein
VLEVISGFSELAMTSANALEAPRAEVVNPLG